MSLAVIRLRRSTHRPMSSSTAFVSNVSDVTCDGTYRLIFLPMFGCQYFASDISQTAIVLHPTRAAINHILRLIKSRRN